jgi:hypothetical protein
MIQNIKEDIEFGKKAEKVVKPILEEIFGKLIDGETYDNFDFHNDKYFVEHKQRNVNFGRYNGLMFDKVKYNKYLQLKKENPKLRFFICWSCKNGKYIWEFTDDEKQYETFKQTRDRGMGIKTTDMINVKNKYIIEFNNLTL